MFFLCPIYTDESGSNLFIILFCCHQFDPIQIIGPSGVRALPLAAGINVGGLYKWHFGPSVLRAPAEQTKVATVLGN